MLYNVTINFEIKRKTGLLYIKEEANATPVRWMERFFSTSIYSIGYQTYIVNSYSCRGAKIKPFEIIMEFSSKF